MPTPLVLGFEGKISGKGITVMWSWLCRITPVLKYGYTYARNVELPVEKYAQTVLF